MSDETPDIPPSEETPEDSSPTPARRGAVAAWWLASLPSLLVVVAAVGFGYLSFAGVDIAWAVGTSGWTAPPGATLAGHDIGGKTFDELTDTLDTLNDEFANLSVWLVESPTVLSIVDGEFVISTVFDEVAISVAPTELGLSLDIAGMRRELAAIDETSRDMWSVADRLKLWNAPPELPARLSVDRETAGAYLEGVKSTVDCEPMNAVLDLDSRRLAPSRDGISVDVEATISKLPTEIMTLEDILGDLALYRTRADVTEEDFADIDVENPLASYTTHFNRWKRNRSRNIEMVAAHFEGVVIQPGEVFSFNECTGPRTFAEGYLLAPMYRDRRIELSPAGGSCQVSTTLYNVALLAGLEIVVRYPHSRPCSYVPYGRDATVAYDNGVDLEFRSTLDHPIILHQEVDRHEAGTITFEVYGHPDDRVYVEIGNAYSWVARTESMTEYIVDRSLAPGEEAVDDRGVNGIVQRAWRTWLNEEGEELYTEELSYDRLRPVGALIRHNPDGDEIKPPSSADGAPSDEAPREDLLPGVF